MARRSSKALRQRGHELDLLGPRERRINGLSHGRRVRIGRTIEQGFETDWQIALRHARCRCDIRRGPGRSRPPRRASRRSRSSKSVIAERTAGSPAVKIACTRATSSADRRQVVPEDTDRPGLGEHQSVNGLEQRYAPPGAQRAIQGSKGGRLVNDIDQYRPSRRHIHRVIANAGQVLGGSGHELGPIERFARQNRLSTALQKRRGHVREDHLAFRTNTIESFEPDQPVARADIEQRPTFERLGVSEHPAADGGQTRERGLSLLLAAPVAALENPSRPTIGLGCHRTSISAPCDPSRSRGARFRLD